MSEIKEQDNLSQTEEQEKPKFRDAIKLFEDYRDSNYSKDYINELDENDQCIIGYYIQLISDSFNIKLEDRNNDLISRIAIAFLKAMAKILCKQERDSIFAIPLFIMQEV